MYHNDCFQQEIRYNVQNNEDNIYHNNDNNDNNYNLENIDNTKNNKIDKEEWNEFEQVEDDKFLHAMVVFKDQAVYLPEWIEYYLLQGVSHFYFYDNESKDNPKATMCTYTNQGLVFAVHVFIC